MRLKSKTILSIGTNVGDRKTNITDCVIEINEQLGGVLQVSHVYETPAWGFKSDPFYNAAVLLETSLSPKELLKMVQKIENQLGKERHENSLEYHARIIDIDIISYEDEVVDSLYLQIPHAHFHKRNFVLLPMLEFDYDWIHPLLQKSIPQLLSDCTDDSVCSKIEITYD